MAYMAKIEAQAAQLAPRALDTTTSEFSGLEWSVIRLARTDRLWTIRESSGFGRFWNWLVGRGNPQLANPKLEALRRMAVLTWHYGFTVPGDAVREFLSAGFTPNQYELMAGCINSAISAQRRIAA
jgi:hypothetical protein